MKFHIRHEIQPKDSFRVSALKGLYDLETDKYVQEISGELGIEGIEWNVGLIVGSSGSGKSSIAKKCFGEPINFVWSNKSLIDDFPSELKSNEIFEALSAVGFASPPSWLKQFSVLSNGEKMRVELARAVLSNQNPIVFDEFTSVVDRQIAQVGSLAIQKYIRRAKKKFIAVACHRDIIPWLEPDWIFDTDKREFFFIQKGSDLSSSLQSASARVSSGPSLANIII